ncbi:MAG: hypothetical protein U0Q15_16785 [Kineosporiaceae bacterium]
MQATVLAFDPTTSSGTLVRDDGVTLPFAADAFVASRLLHLRPGQRLTYALDEDGRVGALALETAGQAGRRLPSGR